MNWKKNIFFSFFLCVIVVPNKTMQHTIAQHSKQESLDTSNNNLEDFFAEIEGEEMAIPEIKKLNWLEKHLCTLAIKIALTYGFIRDSLQAWYTSLTTKK